MKPAYSFLDGCVSADRVQIRLLHEVVDVVREEVVEVCLRPSNGWVNSRQSSCPFIRRA
jgi:hypothetical protein